MNKSVYFLGLAGSVIFFLQDIAGIALWKEYNPITTYISTLTADGAPNLVPMRTLADISRSCMVIFMLSLFIFSYKEKHKSIPTGYFLLFLMSAISLFGFGLFPATINFIFSMQNVIHIIITIIMLVITSLALFVLAIGYIQKKKTIGKITLCAAILFLVFNLIHLAGILSASNILGLLQRLTVYAFYIYTIILSLVLMKYIKERKKTNPFIQV